jgi:subtilase family serine protease
MRRVHPHKRSVFLAAAGATALATCALVTLPAMSPAAAASAAPVRPVPATAGHQLVKALTGPVSTTQCQAQFGISCYTPTQYRTAYDLNPLYRAGITGKGRTIVIVDSYGSPTIQHDLDTYSKQFGMKSSHVDVMKWGKVPTFDPNDSVQRDWAGETTLDVEMAHAVAPDAHILLVETGVAETEGVTGLPEMMSAEKFLIDHNVGDVITQSFGATENTFPGFDKGNFSSIQNLRYAFKDAEKHNVTVLASSGDDGATGDMADGVTEYPMQVNSWPSADPLVTSIGGTQLHLDDQGNRTAPESTYNDNGAGGGGRSNVFARPSYQNGVKNIVGNRRGTPDISMSAAVDGGAWVYSSYAPIDTGWGVSGGTSEASPLFSGIVALADQVAGHRIGDIHKALYKSLPGTVDVKDGTNNTVAGVTGFTAAKGYDMATGVGTVDAARFVPALAFLSRH